MDALETSAPTDADEAVNASSEHADDASASDEMMSDEESRVIELVGWLVQGLVDHPEEVEVEEFVDSAGTVYGVRVHPDDTGRVIGRDGRVVNALRNLAKASATKIGTHVTVEILTED